MTDTVTKPNGTELTHWAPWADEFPWPGRVAQFMDSMWRAAAGDGNLAPTADVTEAEASFTVEIDLPGVERKDITVDVTDRRLTVTGKRVVTERKGIVRHSSRVAGQYDFAITLPSAVDSAETKAKFVDGVLTIELPKTSKTQTTRVEVS